jgi:hypothetical protein
LSATASVSPRAPETNPFLFHPFGWNHPAFNEHAFCSRELRYECVFVRMDALGGTLPSMSAIVGNSFVDLSESEWRRMYAVGIVNILL